MIFPKDWDLSELETLAGSRHCGRVSYEREDLDRLAEKAGLTADLRAVFGGNMEMVNA